MEYKRLLGGIGTSAIVGGSIAYWGAPTGEWLPGMIVIGMGIAILTVMLFTKTTDSVFNWVGNRYNKTEHTIDSPEDVVKGSWSADGKRK